MACWSLEHEDSTVGLDYSNIVRYIDVGFLSQSFT